MASKNLAGLTEKGRRTPVNTLMWARSLQSFKRSEEDQKKYDICIEKQNSRTNF